MKNKVSIGFLGIVSLLGAMESPRKTADLVDLGQMLKDQKIGNEICPIAGKSVYLDYGLAQAIVSISESVRALHTEPCIVVFQGYIRENTAGFNTGGKVILDFKNTPQDLVHFLCGLHSIAITPNHGTAMTLSLCRELSPANTDIGTLRARDNSRKKKGGK